jgi:hypothetical protein
MIVTSEAVKTLLLFDLPSNSCSLLMSQESAPRKESAFVHLLAGASAGMCSGIVVALF